MASPRGLAIRPTPDHIREAVFSILGQNLDSWIVLEGFAGTGILSMEALSRGAAHAVLLDHSPKALNLIRRNAARLQVEDRVRPILWDLRRGFGPVERLGRRFDLVFLDPPYSSGLAETILAKLGDRPFLSESAWVVVEHSQQESPGSAHGRLILADHRKYGQTRVSFYRPS